MTHQHILQMEQEQETPFRCLSHCYLLNLILHFSKNFVASWFNLKYLEDHYFSTKNTVGTCYMNVGEHKVSFTLCTKIMSYCK